MTLPALGLPLLAVWAGGAARGGAGGGPGQPALPPGGGGGGRPLPLLQTRPGQG